MKMFQLPLALIAALSFFTASFATTSDYYLIPNGADGDVAQARQAFERFYRDLALHGHFDLSYNNNLTINTLLEGDVQKEGAIMLTLLNWLAHRKDHDSKFLLKRLNHLYFLELHNLFSSIDSNKDATARMLQLCDQLFHYKAINPITQQTKKPFRTSLSRLFIVITTINGSDMAYENRKKSMALALERVGNKMLRINKRLGDQKMNPQDITAFISLLATHVAVEPLVKSSVIRNTVLTILIASIIISLIYSNWDTIQPWISNGLKKMTSVADETLKSLFGYIGEGLGDGIIKSALKQATPENKEQLKDFLQEGGDVLGNSAAKGMLHGLVTKQPHQAAAPDEVNPDLKLAVDTVLDGVQGKIREGSLFFLVGPTAAERRAQARAAAEDQREAAAERLARAQTAAQRQREAAAERLAQAQAAAQRRQDFEANQQGRNRFSRAYHRLGYELQNLVRS
jgi:hypothetical protein